MAQRVAALEIGQNLTLSQEISAFADDSESINEVIEKLRNSTKYAVPKIEEELKRKHTVRAGVAVMSDNTFVAIVVVKRTK